jgi:hypothetical protein
MGPIGTAAAVVVGIFAGTELSPRRAHDIAGTAWVVGLALLLVAAARYTDSEVIPAWLLAGYAVVFVCVDPSARPDGDAQMAILLSAILLAPFIGGGVALPRRGLWLAAIGCWCISAAVATAASATAHHPSAAVGVLSFIWD